MKTTIESLLRRVMRKSYRINSPSALNAAISENAWAVDSDYAATIPTMLSPTELKMLEWLARKMRFENGACIVDAGSFLGGSTCALAAGLAANPLLEDKQSRIHAYDMFRAPNDLYAQGFFGENRALGSSVLDIFERNIASYRSLVKVHAGDFSKARAPSTPIGLLFVDVAKSWELNETVIRNFFPRLVPGESVVVQQDHNDHSCPWVNITMELFADCFEYLTDDTASRVFLNTRRVPYLSYELRTLPADEKLRPVSAAADRSKNPDSRYLSASTRAWILYEVSGRDAAMSYLDRIEAQQPWVSEPPYVATIRAGINYVANLGGHDNFLAGYFGSSQIASDE